MASSINETLKRLAYVIDNEEGLFEKLMLLVRF